MLIFLQIAFWMQVTFSTRSCLLASILQHYWHAESLYSFPTLRTHQLSLQVKGLRLLFSQSPQTSLQSWTTEQIKMPIALTVPHPLLTHIHKNVLKTGSVLHPAYKKGSWHLPKVQPTNNKAPWCTSACPLQLKSMKGKQEEDYADNLLPLFNHKAQRRAFPAQSGLDIWAQLNTTAHRTKPALAAIIEPGGVFTPVYTYLWKDTHIEGQRGCS